MLIESIVRKWSSGKDRRMLRDDLHQLIVADRARCTTVIQRCAKALTSTEQVRGCAIAIQLINRVEVK